MAKGYIFQMETRDGDDVYPVTKADAVYLQETSSDGTTTQQKLSDKIEAMTSSFTAGCNTIVAALTELGVTPEATTPEGIAAAIQQMYTDRYDAGVEQGHNDVIADPGAYGLITQEAYDKHGEEEFLAGVEYADGRVNKESASFTAGFDDADIEIEHYGGGDGDGDGINYYSGWYYSGNGGNKVQINGLGTEWILGKNLLPYVSQCNGISLIWSSVASDSDGQALKMGVSQTGKFSYVRAHAVKIKKVHKSSE